MRKLIIILLALGLVLSVPVVKSTQAENPPVSLKVLQLPVKPYHVRVWGDEVIICGHRLVKGDDGYEKDIVALAVGSAEGGFSLKYAPVPENYEWVQAWPPKGVNDKVCRSVARYGSDLYIFSTTHNLMMWRVGDRKYDLSNAHGWGADDIAIFAGKILGNVESAISVHRYRHDYTLITGPLTQFESQYNDWFTPYILVPIGNTLYLLGPNGYIAVDENFNLTKIIPESETEPWPVPRQIGQAAYDVYKNRYIIYTTDYYPNVAVFDTKTGKFNTITISGRTYGMPAGPAFLTVTPSGIVYVAVQNTFFKGKIVALKFDEKNLSFTELWEKLISQPIYALDNYGETIYIAMGEDGLGILSTGGLSFSDVPQGYWAYDAIMALAQKGVINGYPDGTFRPDKGVTRAEFAKMLAVYMNLPLQCDPSLPEIKKDVKEKDWFCPYVSAVVKAGYMKGYGGGRFGPNDPVKKEEILTTLVRIKGYKLLKPDTPTFPDVPKTHWAYPYIETAVAHGLVKKIDPNITDGNFHLGKPATRAQTAVFLYRAGE